MRFQVMRLVIGLFVCCGMTAAVIGLATEALGQARPNTPQLPPGTVTNPEMHDRETNITLMERGNEEAKNRDAALKQMNEDFQRIQTLGMDLSNVSLAGNPPDYKKVSETASDIKVRATRLKNSLVLPPSGKDEKRRKEQDEDKTELASMLSALSDSIKSFAGNPIFQQRAQQPADAQDVAKARVDLDEVIRLSSRIIMAADQQSKSPVKPN